MQGMLEKLLLWPVVAFLAASGALHESYDTLEGRRIAWRAIELQLAGWTATRSDRDVMATLQAQGVCLDAEIGVAQACRRRYIPD